MFETLGFTTLTAPEAAVWLGGALGAAFGVLAERTRFCFRRAVAGPNGERRAALALWLTALAASVLGTQAAVAAGLVEFSGHRFHAGVLPVAAIVAGGLLFGAGMVLTRGCVSRLTVLTGSGNLRALLVLAVFAIVAHATMKGVLAPLRSALGAHTLELGGALPGAPIFWAGLVAATALAVARRAGAGAGPAQLVMAAAIGLLIPAGWAGTGFVLHDDFDPVALQSLAFTAPVADTLFWAVAATSIPASFGVGLVGGVVFGSFASARAAGRFRWESFESPAQTGRYMAGAALMGIGGVLAGGCTVGAGLAGVPTLGLAAVVALVSITAGARLAAALLAIIPSNGESGAPSATRPPLPAE
jgi:uncharacterized membrane protein YedE/YeeE